MLIPRLAGLAALCFTVLMAGALATHVFVLDFGALAITPMVLGILFGLIAYARRAEIRALAEPRR